MARKANLTPEEEEHRRRVRESLFQEALQEPMDYFSHDTDALNDDALYELFESRGYAGLGMFWRLIELLTRKRGHSYKGCKLLSHEMYLSEDECSSFIAELASIGLVDAEMYGRGMISSKRVNHNAEKYANEISRARLGAALTNGRA